ncbi:MAG: hypothetical protein M5U34_41055 [Chloroflexi bacterium]|nr:hypothetical protein [Chloroflexota bacterium]
MSKKQRRKAVISRQINRLDARLAALQQSGDRLSRWRLVVFVVGVITAVVALLQWGIWPWLAVSVVVVAAFAIVVRLHRKVDNARQRIQLWRQIKQTHLARMDLAWADLPPPRLFPIILTIPLPWTSTWSAAGRFCSWSTRPFLKKAVVVWLIGSWKQSRPWPRLEQGKTWWRNWRKCPFFVIS